MAKADQEAFNNIASIVNNGGLIQIEKVLNGYEVTVWPDKYNRLEHVHCQGQTLLEALSKAVNIK